MISVQNLWFLYFKVREQKKYHDLTSSKSLGNQKRGGSLKIILGITFSFIYTVSS